MPASPTNSSSLSSFSAQSDRVERQPGNRRRPHAHLGAARAHQRIHPLGRLPGLGIHGDRRAARVVAVEAEAAAQVELRPARRARRPVRPWGSRSPRSDGRSSRRCSPSRRRCRDRPADRRCSGTTGASATPPRRRRRCPTRVTSSCRTVPQPRAGLRSGRARPGSRKSARVCTPTLSRWDKPERCRPPAMCLAFAAEHHAPLR